MSGYTDLTKMETSRNCLRRLARHDEPQFSKDSIVNVMEKFVKTVNVMDDTILVPCRLMDRQIGDSTDIIPPSGKDSTSNQHSVNGRRNTKNSKNVHEFLSSSELFNLYSMLNALKNDLLWTGKKETDDDEDEEENYYLRMENSESKTDIITNATSPMSLNSVATTATATATSTTTATPPTIKGHTRCPSTASVASTASVSAISDSESEISNENDSGVESESNKNGSAASSSSNSSVEGSKPNKKNSNSDKATELAKRTRRHLNGLYKCLEQMTEAANYLTARYQSDIGHV